MGAHFGGTLFDPLLWSSPAVAQARAGEQVSCRGKVSMHGFCALWWALGHHPILSYQQWRLEDRRLQNACRSGREKWGQQFALRLPVRAEGLLGPPPDSNHLSPTSLGGSSAVTDPSLWAEFLTEIQSIPCNWEAYPRRLTGKCECCKSRAWCCILNAFFLWKGFCALSPQLDH